MMASEPVSPPLATATSATVAAITFNDDINDLATGGEPVHPFLLDDSDANTSPLYNDYALHQRVDLMWDLHQDADQRYRRK
jgi:hypothetical protein